MTDLTANLAFPFTVLAGVLCASLQSRKCGWDSLLATAHVNAGGGTHSFFCSLWLVWSDYCLKVSVLLGCPALGSLARENRFWGWGFFFSPVSLCISGMLAFSAPCLGWYTWDKKIQGTHHYISSRVLRSLATLLSLHLSEISYVCFTYIA